MARRRRGKRVTTKVEEDIIEMSYDVNTNMAETETLVGIRRLILSLFDHCYRLCIAFLAFSCIGYAIPFILFATVCCCFPCIVSVLGFREDFRPSRGATSEVINSLPTYKFKSKRRADNSCNSKYLFEAGTLTYGIEREQMTSSEDAGCCICLAKLVDNDKLRELPCSHFFHRKCVDKWLKINALCPLCKAEIGGTSSSLFAYLTSSVRRFASGINSSGLAL